MKRLRITVDGKVYDVVVEMLDEAPAASAPISAPPAPPPAVPAPIAAPGVSPPRERTASGAGDVTSPLAGKVVSIDVKPGQDVREGIQVAIVEAMKMNTYIYAPKTGKVAAVLVHPGDAVEEGAVLLRLA